MKKFIFILCALLICSVSHAQTETMNWYVDGETYATTQCESGGDVILPTAPTKRGYTFEGWGAKYTRVEYIEATGTQYIDTGFVPNQNSGMLIDFYTDRANQHSIAIIDDPNTGFGFGVSQSTSDPDLKMFIKAGAYSNEIWRIYSLYGNGTGRYQVNINGRDASVSVKNGPTINQTFSTFTSATTLSLWLFAVHRTEAVIIYSNGLKIYSCKLYDNGVLVRDFIPVLDYHDVPCMFDKVSGTFFYNAGTGDFIAGPVIEGE